MILSSNLTKEGIAYDAQIVKFTCITRGIILSWRSDDYIESEYPIMFTSLTDSPGMMESSSTHPMTIATLTNVTTYANTGETAMVSELHIRASAVPKLFCQLQ